LICDSLSLILFAMILISRLFSPFVLLLALAACDPVSLTLGAGATTGVAVYQERGIEGVARDTAIESRIFKLWIETDKKMATHMSIEVYESRALLTGLAGSEQERATAVGLAWKAEGIKDVMNEVLIGESEGLGEFARDISIAAELKSRLTFDSEVLAVNYAIETVRGVIFLLGIAQDQVELDRVVAQARNISYVKRVVSYVRVKTPEENEKKNEGDT